MYDFGRVAFAYYPFQGSSKDRPVVLIDHEFDERVDDEIYVVPISTKFREPLPHHHVLVYDRHVYDPRTGLSKPCVAKCEHVMSMPTRKIVRRFGYLSDELLERIEAAIDMLDDSEGP